ncbi:hypothetical protein I302_108743 [Kwoniella bestiolae CBS 10118]|uniref:Sulfhydryl oxidase n=1 Tax=Kwoniella bestiolae CBS 10118 TaxID=1296100 RepID=A0A1B9FTY4_9TREE|nr:thiol oxidase [Kwoniella bestiolae CBS 10118]OCF22235.1 thiol oxidase [Kwoniella bestiolae CBS 10118]
MLSQLGHLPRFIRLTLLATFLIVIPTLYFLYPTPERLPSPGEYQAGGIDSEHWRTPVKPDYLHEEVREWDDELPLGSSKKPDGWKGLSEETINGGVIMPKLGNETAKAELGRSAWRVLHLMTLRYPDEPTEDDRQALKSYFHLFSRLYPCGECAAEFQKLLKDYPPQTGSRKSASLWLCHVHNLVNERLGKSEFDCLTLDETYDCGCGDERGTATQAKEAEETGGKNDKNTKVEEEGERGWNDEAEVVLGHGGGEITVKHLNAGVEENGRKGVPEQEERPVHNVPHLPIRPKPEPTFEEEDEEKPLRWKDVTHVKEDESQDAGGADSPEDDWEKDKENERVHAEDSHRHDGSRIKVDHDQEEEFRWDE